MTGTVPEGASTFDSGSETSYTDQSHPTNLLTHLVDVDCWSEGVVSEQVEVSHTDFTEVTRMELTRSAPSPTPFPHLVEVGSVVVLTTSKTSTSRMLPVLSHTTVTGRDVTPVLPGVGESCGHLE